MNTSESVEIMKERASLYSLLARVYRREVDKSFLETLASLSVESDSVKFNEGLKESKEAISNSEDAILDFAVDYARIFLGAGIAKGVAAYPYESVYTSKDRLVMQEAYEKVVKIFRANGVGKLDADLYEDHAALELEFMSLLCRRAVELIEKGDEAGLEENLDLQKSFLNEHLLNWMPEFLETIRRCPGSGFYKGFSKATEAFLGMEKELFG